MKQIGAILMRGIAFPTQQLRKAHLQMEIAGNTTSVRDAMGRAYCKWMDYANMMDAQVLAEYTNLGGTGTPICWCGGRHIVYVPQGRFLSFT